jgi:hypothetical protein
VRADFIALHKPNAHGILPSAVAARFDPQLMRAVRSRLVDERNVAAARDGLCVDRHPMTALR